MKVTLVSPYNVVVAYGVRILSAVLKTRGIETQMVMLPPAAPESGWHSVSIDAIYSTAVLDQLSEIAGDSGLVGISLTSNYFQHAVQITEHLRQSIQAPIIWGGVHPTLRPEECLDYADLVCVGEGEEALSELALQLARGAGDAGIRNIWSRRAGEIVRTPLRPLTTDLDSLPYPDYDLNAEYLLHRGSLQPTTRELLCHYFRFVTHERLTTYRAILSRSCQYRCTYCANNALNQIYGDTWRVRRRSVPNLIAELKWATTRFPEKELITIDDEYFIDNLETVGQFSRLYQQEIGLPFVITGMFPAQVDQEKIELLVDAGMVRANVGIQTGSMRVMHQVYRRPCKLAQIEKTFEVLSRYPGRFEPTYQFILDNPWETEQDHLETLRLIARLKKPYRLGLFSLTLFPGTELAERGRREGLIGDERVEVYRKNYSVPGRSYINTLFHLFESQHVPRWLITRLMSAPMHRLKWIWLPDSVQRLFHLWMQIKRGLRMLFSGEWRRLLSILQRRSVVGSA